MQFLSRYKLFYPLFWVICLNFIFKSFIFPFFTPLPDYDTLEGLYLGNFSEFGNYKHPPLLNFTIQLIDFLWNRNILALSVVSQLYLSLVYIFTFKLAKEFTNHNNAILATILIGFFPAFSTTSHIFHQDIIIILPFVTSIYFYHKLLQKNNISSAIYLGISIGLGMLGKYFFAIQVFTIIFHAIFFTKLLKNPKIYLAGLISILTFSPHIFWNFANHFMIIDYVKSANINAGKLSPSALLLNGFLNVAIFVLLIGLLARKMPNFGSLKINKNLNLILYFGIFNLVILFIIMFAFGMEGKSRFLKMFMPIIPLFAIILINKNFEVKQVKQFFILIFIALLASHIVESFKSFSKNKLENQNFKQLAEEVELKWHEVCGVKPIKYFYSKADYRLSDFWFFFKDKPRYVPMSFANTPYLQEENYEKEGGVIIFNAFKEPLLKSNDIPDISKHSFFSHHFKKKEIENEFIIGFYCGKA